jgi:hypothetical protein
LPVRCDLQLRAWLGSEKIPTSINGIGSQYQMIEQLELNLDMFDKIHLEVQNQSF